MAQILNIVESAYRATLEEQDDTVLWLTHMLKNLGADVAILLQGNAVCYLAKDQDASGLSFGATTVNHPSALDRDVAQMVEKNIPVFAVEEDIRERGLADVPLVTGFKPVGRRAVAELLDQHDQVWRW